MVVASNPHWMSAGRNTQYDALKWGCRVQNFGERKEDSKVTRLWSCPYDQSYAAFDRLEPVDPFTRTNGELLMVHGVYNLMAAASWCGRCSASLHEEQQIYALTSGSSIVLYVSTSCRGHHRSVAMVTEHSGDLVFGCFETKESWWQSRVAAKRSGGGRETKARRS